VSPKYLLPVAVVLVAVLMGAPVPILDEESYLAITAHFDVWRPYNWWRPWPPWYGGTEPDAFVYAHPPLFLEWVAMWRGLSDDPVVARALCGVPMAALLGWSAGRLIERVSARPALAMAVWFSAPIVVLGVQRGLMPDLMVAALATTAVMGWREAESADPHKSLRWLIFGGLALGLAAWTKYPALALVPVLMVHGWWAGRLRATWPFWVAAAIPWLAGEVALVAIYGRVHLVEVLTRASEISRGTGPGRALGLLVRIPLGVAALGLFVRGYRWLWIPAFVLGGAVSLWSWPADMTLGQRLTLSAWAIVGAAFVALAVFALVRGWRRRDGDRVLLSLWVLSVFGGVWAVHNFAAPRYLLPAMLPLALLLVREVGALPVGRTLLLVGAGLHLVGGIVLTAAEHRFFSSAADLADQIQGQLPAGASGSYTGEWSFRWRMDAHGWDFYTGEPASGTLVAAPTNSSPGALPAGWTEVTKLHADSDFPVRVVHDSMQIGLYAETLGALPVGWADGPVEEVTLWRVP
jgi:hypothetical protein